MANSAPLSEERETASKRVVLVVEDEILIRALTAEHLRDIGFNVIEAANAAEAVTVFSSRTNIDVVFTDINMPGEMDGLMLARWIDEHHPGISVLLTSGLVTSSNASRVLLEGRPFIQKPYPLDELEMRLMALVQN
jgi:CheY-like chemotaxis protein